jgi:hypothetical protein
MGSNFESFWELSLSISKSLIIIWQFFKAEFKEKNSLQYSIVLAHTDFNNVCIQNELYKLFKLKSAWANIIECAIWWS